MKLAQRRCAQRKIQRAVYAALIESLEDRTLLSVFTVINTSDSGVGSLRWALDQANSNPGVDTIAFDITSPDKTIHVLTELPALYDAGILDATTQPGYAGKPLIQIDGSQAVANAAGRLPDGIQLFGNDVLKGLDITGFGGQAVTTLPRPDRNYGGNIIQGCWMGVDLDGKTVDGCRAHGVGIYTSGNLVGGPHRGDGNVISGSTFADGMWISGTNANSNVIEGNFIGTTPDGQGRAGNYVNGIAIDASAGNQIINNVISANGGDGIVLSSTADDQTIQGNLIGLSADGKTAMNNKWYGIEAQTGRNLIGGPVAADRNIISGNLKAGIVVFGNTAIGNQIQGNYIGTDITGTVAIPNQQQGICTFVASNTTVVGNLVSGNNDVGVALFPGFSTTLQNNTIGLDANGNPLPNASYGVQVINGSTNTIIGGAAGSGNVIASNGKGGIYDGEPTTTITYNQIINNNGPGVVIMQGGTAVEYNSIYGNSALGIDVSDDGVTLNSAYVAGKDEDFPVISSASSDGSTTTITGSLFSGANTTFTVCFYTSAAADPSGYGQGQTYIGQTIVDTDASGNATFSVTLPQAIAAGNVLAATATDGAGNTSEFSLAVTPTVTSPGGTGGGGGAPADSVLFSQPTYTAHPAARRVSITVTRVGDLSAAASVNYATLNGSALAGADYDATSGTLLFTAGQSSATITIKLLKDKRRKRADAFSVLLTDPNGATMGSYATAAVQIARR